MFGKNGPCPDGEQNLATAWRNWGEPSRCFRQHKLSTPNHEFSVDTVSSSIEELNATNTFILCGVVMYKTLHSRDTMLKRDNGNLPCSSGDI
jgi:hypothetical protein